MRVRKDPPPPFFPGARRRKEVKLVFFSVPTLVSSPSKGGAAAISIAAIAAKDVSLLGGQKAKDLFRVLGGFRRLVGERKGWM